MSNDQDYYAMLDRLDKLAQKEREEALARQAQERSDLDRVALEQKLAQDEHFRVLDEQREAHAREHQEMMDRLLSETIAREQHALEAERIRSEQIRAEEIRAAQAAEEHSRQDVAASKFAADFATDLELEQRKQREVEATIGNIDDPEMAEYVSQQRHMIEEKYIRLEEARLAEAAHEKHEREARAGDLTPPNKKQVEDAEREKFERDLIEIQIAAEELIKRAEAKARQDVAQGELSEEEAKAKLTAIREAAIAEKERLERLAREEAERRLARSYEYTRV